MNKELILNLTNRLSKVEAIESCLITIEEQRGHLILSLEKINSTNKRFRTDKGLHFPLQTVFSESFSLREPEAIQFLMETNLKLKDMVLLDNFFLDIRSLNWEVGEFMYERNK